jgi:endoplasmic reticulum protein 29
MCLSRKGLWIGLPACIEEFDGYIREFFQSSDADHRTGVIKKAEEAAAAITKEDVKERADVYVKTFQKILEKGDEFVPGELDRVERLREGKVSEKKKELLKARASILTSFQLWMKSSHDEL